MARLDGKVAVITGAGSGMGLATAHLFHAEGAQVVLMDISGAEADVAAELGDRAVAFHGSIIDPEDARNAMATAISRFGALDILANIAGATVPQRETADVPLGEFDRMIDINLRGTFVMTQAALRHMIAGARGSIVNVASSAALIGMPSRAAYSAAKTGVLGLTRSVALEYARQGIRVNAVAPGAVLTPLLQARFAENPQVLEQVVASTPAGRMGTPEEIAQSILFLSSDESTFITGIVLPVDGGFTAG